MKRAAGILLLPLALLLYTLARVARYTAEALSANAAQLLTLTARLIDPAGRDRMLRVIETQLRENSDGEPVSVLVVELV